MTDQYELHYNDDLPIMAARDEIIAAIRAHQVVVIAGETGSGKTTQLPKLCLEAGRQRIGHTQPRRIAARSVAERIAEEMHAPLGELVGYQVRFTKKAGRETRIKVMTDGVLLNEIGIDRELRRYDTIIIDEAHERSLNIDFLLGYLKQLLPKRPELKVIVTSATIDTSRFAQHFNGAPVIEVTGRTYPVEVRYRPLYEDGATAAAVEATQRDQLDAITDAVKELSVEGNGDILVFLSGEREIRDTAEHLDGQRLRATEIVPLYARLSAAEQHRVFQAHSGRRIVLATNVAETSLTVPGIRYVIDAGMARISRYSAKTKVQRLPIEPISQASANQRSGRCGRVAPGIAIRLYSEQDFALRPEFTEPEILRTNLASVILQMADARLGDIADFPFVEAPDRSQINDGLRLLDELGALASGKSATPKLTAIGKKLARIPVDPRLGRMLIAASERHCLREVTAIVAGLSIQDPRERPQEHRDAADALHRRFWSDAILTGDTTGEPGDSDFLALWRLWSYLRQQQKELSGNAFRRHCREEYLNFLRIREWQDLVAQLREACHDLGLERNDSPGTQADIHTAILTGVLSHIGLADVRHVDPNLPLRKRIRLGPQEYLGARGAKFAIQRGSCVAKQPPNLVMAFELVETTRLWARTVAAIDPSWVEQAGEHLLKRQYSEPHWSSKSGAAVAYERVILLGVPIIDHRQVFYARINPAEARQIFIQSALVEGDWHTRHHFFARNQAVRAQAEEMEERTRRRDLLISDAQLAQFYDARIPAEVVSQRHFDSWWRTARHHDEQLLDLSLDDLLDPEAGDFDEQAFPDDWHEGDFTFPITYTFDPGTGHDGVTVTVPLNVLNQVSPEPFSWQVPGLRTELATELIRGLPKNIRTRFVPAPNFASQALSRLDEADHSVAFPIALGRALADLTGTEIPANAWNPAGLPAHLRIRFEIADGATIAAHGDELPRLQRDLAKQLSAQLTQAAKKSARTGATSWVFGELPLTATFQQGAITVVGYPALVDEGKTVGLAVLDTELRQGASQRAGLRRLVSLVIPDPTKSVVAHLGMEAKLALGNSPYKTVPDLLADARLASVGYLIDTLADPLTVRSQEHFLALKDQVRQDHAENMQRVVGTVAETLRWRQRLELALVTVNDADARKDLQEQADNLIFPGFISATPQPWFGQLPRYLRAAVHRVEARATNPRRDDDNLDVIWELEDLYSHLCAAMPQGPLPRDVADIGWLLEELRVSLFAQTLGTHITVSAKRIRHAIAAAEQCERH
ncbi:MAG: ATP-dependent RNA helicase HrpA [Propionibacteriaceae bacterium]